MYYQLSSFYKRDIYFTFNQEGNSIDFSVFDKGENIDNKLTILYQIDKIDDYLNSYDFLPTIGPMLVSTRFKNVFLELSNSQVQFLPAIIKDKNGNHNENFFSLNVLNITSCMDMEKSITEKTRYGTLKIKKLMFLSNSLNELDITRMREHLSYIIVSQNFKDKCISSGLTGMNFIEEGHSIYTNL